MLFSRTTYLLLNDNTVLCFSLHSFYLILIVSESELRPFHELNIYVIPGPFMTFECKPRSPYGNHCYIEKRGVRGRKIPLCLRLRSEDGAAGGRRVGFEDRMALFVLSFFVFSLILFLFFLLLLILILPPPPYSSSDSSASYICISSDSSSYSSTYAYTIATSSFCTSSLSSFTLFSPCFPSPLCFPRLYPFLAGEGTLKHFAGNAIITGFDI